ncbi:hypothetical protein EDD11_010225 [Mortierella claussenii]|nr:hypothetical protein EDD11_010225 [Mortierella claussenii]
MMPIRPCTEQLCTALVQASIRLQPSTLQMTSTAPNIWQRVLEAWRIHRSISPSDPVDVENISADFANCVLFPQAAVVTAPSTGSSTGGQTSQPMSINPNHNHTAASHHPKHAASVVRGMAPAYPHTHQSLQPSTASAPATTPLQTPHIPQIWVQSPSQPTAAISQSNTSLSVVDASGGPNSTAVHSTSSAVDTSSSTSAMLSEPFRKRISHLLTDERRFHAPAPVLRRLHQFFNGPPQLDPAAFEGSTLDATIAVPFPDIMDTDGWRTPVPDINGQTNGAMQFAPIQSCFLHVPILPSKRRYETDTEVITLDDVRLAGQLNFKLWEEFSNGNVVEAISIVPSSAAWFGKTELADWPCVVMSGLKFEQANGTDPSGKKCSEVHSYIAVYLGRDPMRQALFVHLFQDLGISATPSPENSLMPTGLAPSSKASHHRWIAGFRRLFRTQGPGGSRIVGPSSSSSGHEHWYPSEDDDQNSIDPQFDDIYSIQPPHKKPRLERVGRPSDTRAAWHHSKRRKVDEEEFSKLKDPDLDQHKWESGDEMSE